jgi:beta-glucanase (GH16 family)
LPGSNSKASSNNNSSNNLSFALHEGPGGANVAGPFALAAGLLGPLVLRAACLDMRILSRALGMNRRLSHSRYFAAGVALLLGLLKGGAAANTPDSQSLKNGWTLVWSDEFNGPDGSRPDATKWKFEIGGNGWGNGELEYYTDRPENSFIRGGNLVIRAAKETFTGADKVTRDYTSARITTQRLFEQAYGRFEARIKIPRGQGIWPAFWLLGDDVGKVGWPECGEIDIMENIGKEPSTVHGSMHGPGYSGEQGYTSVYKLPGGVRFYNDFHVFAIEWEPSVVRFFVDQELYATFTPARLPQGKKWVFDHSFFIILNVAVGGDWPGPPDSRTVFPQEMLVDYVRVYKASQPAR